MTVPRFMNPMSLVWKYRDSGYKLLKETENGKVKSWSLEKEVDNVNSSHKELKGVVRVNITSISNGSKVSYGTAIAEIAFPGIVKDNELMLKDVVFEYDRSPKGLVLKKFEKLETCARMF